MPYISFITTGFLSLLCVFLSINVASFRAKNNIAYGDGGNEALIRRIRAHGNFCEYVPLCLIMLLLAEIALTPKFIIGFLAICLVIARLSHAYALTFYETPERKTKKFLFRIIGTMLTNTILIVTALINLTAGISYLAGNF